MKKSSGTDRILAGTVLGALPETQRKFIVGTTYGPNAFSGTCRSRRGAVPPGDIARQYIDLDSILEIAAWAVPIKTDSAYRRAEGAAEQQPALIFPAENRDYQGIERSSFITLRTLRNLKKGGGACGDQLDEEGKSLILTPCISAAVFRRRTQSPWQNLPHSRSLSVMQWKEAFLYTRSAAG